MKDTVSWQYARRRAHALAHNPHRYRYELVNGVYHPILPFLEVGSIVQSKRYGLGILIGKRHTEGINKATEFIIHSGRYNQYYASEEDLSPAALLPTERIVDNLMNAILELIPMYQDYTFLSKEEAKQLVITYG